MPIHYRLCQLEDGAQEAKSKSSTQRSSYYMQLTEIWGILLLEYEDFSFAELRNLLLIRRKDRICIEHLSARRV